MSFSLTHILILAVMVVGVVAVLLATRSGGPRVTTIETKRKDDGDDA